MSILPTLVYLISILQMGNSTTNKPDDYWEYHQLTNKAEVFVSDERFLEALHVYEGIFATYEFVFLRDYKIAAQLALYLDQREKAFAYIEQGIVVGWSLKELRKHPYLSKIQHDPAWQKIEVNYPELRKKYLSTLDNSMRERVQKMFKKDQRKALGAFLRIGEKAKEKYALKKFAPHSETQIMKLIEMLESSGYPGEQLIGNNFWMSTILSHHNSITQDYVKNDTLYHFVRPLLIKAIEKGQMSPYEFALVDDWYIAVSSGRIAPGYGFLNQPRQATLTTTNQLREAIGLRSIALRNQLIDMQNTTGMKFYLPDWIDGKIMIEGK